MRCSLEMAMSSHRSHQPRHSRHRQALPRRHRRSDVERGSQDARGGPAREGPHRGRHRDHHAGAAQGRTRDLRRRRHQRPPRRARSRRRCRRPSAPARISCRRSWPAARTRSFAPREGVEDNYEEGARSINRLKPSKKDVVIGVSASGMTQFVRGALTRARQAGSQDHLRDLRPAHRAADLRRPDDCAGRRPRSHRRIDAPEGRHRHQDRAQHADHRRR